jgi:phage gp29-like protein
MPIRISQLERQFVPYNPNDQYPLHHGARATVAAVGAAMRYSEQGYRSLWVDVLRELLEGDPHAFSILSKRFAAVANKPWDVLAAQVDEQNEREVEAATEVANFVRQAIAAIPLWQTHCRGMLWGNFYGASMRENMWKRRDGDWLIDRLEFVHTRRLDYDEEFRMYVTDGSGTSIGIYPRDPQWEGKFTVFEPRLSDEYPTREGLGRIIAFSMAFKRFGWRDLVAFVESRGKSLVDVAWKNGADSTASEPDINAAKDIVKKIAAGLGSCAHPDTFEINFKGQGSQSGATSSSTPHGSLIDLCDQQESEAVLGGHLTTGTQKRGEGAQASTQSDQQNELTMADGGAWDETVQSCVVRPLVVLNYGAAAAAKYLPTYHTKVEPPEDDELAMKTVSGLVDKGLPVKTSWASERFGIPHAEPGDVVLTKEGKAKLYSEPEDEPEPTEPPSQPAPENDEPTPPMMQPDGEDDSEDDANDSADGNAVGAEEK